MNTDNHEIEIKLDLRQDIDAMVKLRLHRYNIKHCQYMEEHSSYTHNDKTHANFGIFINDECLSGAVGYIRFGWYMLTDFCIDESLRGQGIGKEIIRQIEEFAKKNNCIGVQMDTWNFQAPEFYKKLGYTVWGEFKDCPPGTTHYYLYKKFI